MVDLIKLSLEKMLRQLLREKGGIEVTPETGVHREKKKKLRTESVSCSIKDEQVRVGEGCVKW